MDAYYNIIKTGPNDDGWNRLRQRFADGRPNRPFDHILKIAREHGVRSVLVEPYIDPHYRDEYMGFWGGLFQRYAPTCHRLHFFSCEIRTDLRDLSELQDSYKGYSVVRPVASHPVGRTMLLPPKELMDSGQSVICAAEEVVHPYGYALSIVAMPFISADGSYLRCAHAAMWMALFHAHLAHGHGRRLPREIHEASLGGQVVGRQLPSEGLSDPQILRALHRLQMPAGQSTLPPTPADSRQSGIGSLAATLSRHINSQFPPIVMNSWHAWLVVAHRKTASGLGREHYALYVHDDMRGPYIHVEDPWEDPDRGPWELATPPLPERLFFDAESAEATGTLAMRAAAHDSEFPAPQFSASQNSKRLAFRTYAIRSHQYKADLAGRLPDDIGLGFRATRMPGTVWVVEAFDRDLYDRGLDAVLGEAVLDASAENPDVKGEPQLAAVLVIHVGGSARATTKSVSTPSHQR